MSTWNGLSGYHSLGFLILLPLAPKCWDHRCEPPHWALNPGLPAWQTNTLPAELCKDIGRSSQRLLLKGPISESLLSILFFVGLGLKPWTAEMPGSHTIYVPGGMRWPFLECLSFSVHDSCGFNKTAGGKGQSIHIIKLQIPKNAELRLSWEWTIILRLAFVLNPKWLVGFSLN